MKVYVKKSSDRAEFESNLEDAMRTFKRRVNRDGILQECKKREYYVKPGVKRRLKHEAALKEIRIAQRKRDQRKEYKAKW